jgi:hypothetical protein
MEITGDAGARFLCHDNDCISLTDEQLNLLKTKNNSQAWGYLTREIKKKLPPQQQDILKKWEKNKVDLSPICKSDPAVSHKVKRKD